MSYEAWIRIEHAPITKEEFEKARRIAEEKTGESIPEVLIWDEDKKRNDGKGRVWCEDSARNPSYRAVHEFGKALAKITETPVMITWIDDEGDTSEIYLPDGRLLYEKRILYGDFGVFDSYDGVVEAWKKIYGGKREGNGTGKNGGEKND